MIEFEEWWTEHQKLTGVLYSPKNYARYVYQAGASAMRTRCAEVAATYNPHNEHKWLINGIVDEISKLEVE